MYVTLDVTHLKIISNKCCLKSAKHGTNIFVWYKYFTNIFLLNQKEKNNVNISMVMQVVQSFSVYIITMKQTMVMVFFLSTRITDLTST